MDGAVRGAVHKQIDAQNGLLICAICKKFDVSSHQAYICLVYPPKCLCVLPARIRKMNQQIERYYDLRRCPLEHQGPNGDNGRPLVMPAVGTAREYPILVPAYRPSIQYLNFLLPMINGYNLCLFYLNHPSPRTGTLSINQKGG